MKKRLKKLSLLAFTVGMLTSMTACGEKNTISEETVSKANTETNEDMSDEQLPSEETSEDMNDEQLDAEETEPIKNNNSETGPIILATKRMSEGMQWVSIAGYNGLRSGFVCVDMEGNALFYINGSGISDFGGDTKKITNFSNGSCFITKGNDVYQIDTEGNVLNTYNLETNPHYIIGEDGYVWTEENLSGFDSAGYKYTLYDINGTEITSFVEEGNDPLVNWQYCGKGVWEYYSHNSTNPQEPIFYFTKSNKHLQHESVQAKTIYFYDDWALLNTRPIDVEGDSRHSGGAFVFMNTEGEIFQADIADFSMNWFVPRAVNEGYCIFNDDYENLISYNLSTNEFTAMENEYSDKIDMENLPDQLMFVEGRVALPMIGSDNNRYVGLFDTSWNIVGQPIQCPYYIYTNGKLIASLIDGRNDIAVYDSNGNQLFDVYENGYKVISNFKDGVGYISTSEDSSSEVVNARETAGISTKEDLYGSWQPINENGDYFFRYINMNSVKEIVLN